MQNDKQIVEQLNIHLKELEELNIRIGLAETKGDRNWLDKVVAPRLAFQRADRTTVDNREEFLDKVTQSACRETQVESIYLYGERAVVGCIVTVKSENGDKRYHNLRLFVRHAEQWKLLGWANEPLDEQA